MAEHGIFTLVHFHMQACKPLSRTVIVNHQVVITEYARVFGNGLHNQFAQLRACRFTQQGTDCLLGKRCAAVQNEHGNAKTEIAVYTQSGKMLNNCRS